MTLVFGVVAFGAGLLFPAPLRQQFIQIAKNIVEKPPFGDMPIIQQSSAPAASGTKPPPDLPTKPTTVSAVQASVPAGSLIVTTATISSTSFALQAAQFVTEKLASQLSSSIQMQGVTSTVILMSESNGVSWSVVTVGRFSSAEEALSQRNYLSAKLGLPLNMSVLALPPPPIK